MKRSLTAALITLFLLLVAHGANADPNSFTYSDALGSLMDQADATYLSQKGLQVRTMAGQKSPVNTAFVLGITLQGQVPHLSQYPSGIERFTYIKDEIRSLLEGLCRARNYMDTDGSRITGDQLYFEVFLPGVYGEINHDAVGVFGVDPATAYQPYILDQVDLSVQPVNDVPQQNHLPQPAPAPATGKLINRDPCAKCPGMCLLGVCADGN